VDGSSSVESVESVESVDATTNGSPPSVWDAELRELAHRRQLVQQQGGPESVARHHANGKYTLRERIELLSDPDGFS
jgi:acetyl-CoA carboxylase carboxyltransferase component